MIVDVTVRGGLLVDLEYRFRVLSPTVLISKDLV